ncbi:MAG TPA: hypothetical protein VME43_02995 [Bryobacteraceae bacterium]|nr:hypothetical protein [Bryobacteraceae bacterium]
MTYFPLWIVTLLPGIFYLVLCVNYRPLLNGRKAEIRTIMGRGQTFQKYIQAFASRMDLDGTLASLYGESYGARRYVFPVFELALLNWAAVTILLVKAGFPLLPPAFQQILGKIPPECLAAVGGASLWGMYDSVERFQSIDLSPASLHYLALRLLLTPVIAYPVGLPFIAGAKLLVALAIGAFPVQALLDFLKGQARSKLQLTGQPEPVEPPTLHQLQGMTASMLQRLQSEGFEGAEHVAGADPFKLLLKTNLEWKVILDIIDQAILFDYIGESMALLRPLGIRGAIEIATIQQSLQDNCEREDAMKLVASIAGVLKQEQQGVLNLIRNAYEDVQVDLIWALWGETVIETEDGTMEGDGKQGASKATAA